MFSDMHEEHTLQEKTRKNTAQEVLRKLIQKLKDNVNGDNVDFFVEVKIFAEELAKQYGVEL